MMNSIYLETNKKWTETPIVYNEIIANKKNIIKNNRNKSGIYKWVNKTNGKCYIGSSVNLGSRLSNYLSYNYLLGRTNHIKCNSKSKIYSALISYGYNNFHLVILEYCDRFDVIKKEQFYIDSLKPEYNILKVAGSSLGFRHSEQTKLKFKLRKLSSQALANLKKI